MQFKTGVSAYLQPEFTKVLPLIDEAYREVTGREAVMTSGNDGQHMSGSRHYLGYAGDFRIRDPRWDETKSRAENEKLGRWKHTDEQNAALEKALRRRLNGDAQKDRPYNVVLEVAKVHFHVEYDPK